MKGSMADVESAFAPRVPRQHADRMAQLESVQVHRLLSEDGVDQRVAQTLTRKRELFDDLARISETAGRTPEASMSSRPTWSSVDDVPTTRRGRSSSDERAGRGRATRVATSVARDAARAFPAARA
jgi:hypothetical protein